MQPCDTRPFLSYLDIPLKNNSVVWLYTSLAIQSTSQTISDQFSNHLCHLGTHATLLAHTFRQSWGFMTTFVPMSAKMAEQPKVMRDLDLLC